MNTLVSVVIPCYNVGNYMEECLASVFNQTYLPLDVICIDNNSSDNTWSVLENLKQRHPGLTIDKELKAGANAARNKGLQLAKGEWIQFLDADDLLEPKKIEHQLQLVGQAKDETAFVAAAFKRLKLNGKETISLVIEDNPFLAAFINKSGITSANLWHTASLKKIAGWDETIKSSQEADLMLRLSLVGGKFIVDDTPLTVIRERESGQISQKDPGQNWVRYIEVRLRFLNELKKNGPEHYNRYKSIYQDSLMVSILTLARYDLAKALYYYNMMIKGQWSSAHRFGFSRFKVSLIKAFGLRLYVKLMNYKNSN